MQKSLWLVIVLGVMGLTVGYGAVILSGGTAFANGASCPMQGKSCSGVHCAHDEHCVNGECDANCPGCQNDGNK